MNNDNNTILVQNISPNVTCNHLNEIFNFFGSVTSIDFEPFSSKHRKLIAYIHFSAFSEAENAKESMNGGQIDGQNIEVSLIHKVIKEKEPSKKRRYSRSRSSHKDKKTNKSVSASSSSSSSSSSLSCSNK